MVLLSSEIQHSCLKLYNEQTAFMCVQQGDTVTPTTFMYVGEPHNQNKTTKTTLLQQKDLSDTQVSLLCVGHVYCYPGGQRLREVQTDTGHALEKS